MMVDNSGNHHIEKLDSLYKFRFSETDREAKEKIWQILCASFFQKYIQESDTVLEIACGYGEFIRNIKAGKKIAVDLNPDSAKSVGSDVHFHLGSATDLSFLQENSVDVCFVSNFFEHLPNKNSFEKLLMDIRGVLKTGGILMAMQPNIRYAPGKYWDFFDHHLPLSHLSCAEAFDKSGFEVKELIDRFLPFSTISAYPKHPLLVWLYLRFRPAWRLMGQQFFIVGKTRR